MNKEMKLEFSAYSGSERFARTVCAAFVIPADPTVDEMEEIKTAVSEAVTNSIVHGYGGGSGTVSIAARTDDKSVTYEITDSGCGIADIELAKQPLYSSSPDAERSGMGFSIMEAFTDELKVESEPGKGTKVIMTKRFGKYAR